LPAATGRRHNARTYIETHTDPAVKRIVLLAARAMLSPEAWRRVDGQLRGGDVPRCLPSEAFPIGARSA
jgi:hypothetical protein